MLSKIYIETVEVTLREYWWEGYVCYLSKGSERFSIDRKPRDQPYEVLQKLVMDEFGILVPADEITTEYQPDISAKWVNKKKDEDEDEDGVQCTCLPICKFDCKGQCGCKACLRDYQDFLSME